MSEKNFEDFLKKAVKSYNEPPVRAPREEMWTAIQATRAARPRVIYGGGSAKPVASGRFGPRVWSAAAAAALLLVATGIGIGRVTARPARSTSVATIAPIRANPVTVAGTDAVPTASSGSSGESSTGVRERSGSRSTGQTLAATNRKATGSTGDVNQVDVASVAGPPSRGSNSAYQLATMQHLSDAEALLTSFRARSPADQQMDVQLVSWARQLLSNTRLLLDSPVASDPQRRMLLEDLELVLVQIVQLSPASTPQDRELIEKTIQHDHVMTRLRTAIPAGPQHGS
jgi:hypothetical protein